MNRAGFSFEMSATVGVFGGFFVPWLAVLGAIAALATNCVVVIEREERIVRD